LAAASKSPSRLSPASLLSSNAKRLTLGFAMPIEGSRRDEIGRPMIWASTCAPCDRGDRKLRRGCVYKGCGVQRDRGGLGW
jgi:hypothetical protein